MKKKKLEKSKFDCQNDYPSYKISKGLGKDLICSVTKKIIFLMNFNDGIWLDILNYTNVTQFYEQQNET